LKNTGKDFESLSHKIFSLLSNEDRYTSVELDVQLDSPDGKRQFDVVIRSKVSGLNLLTVIECRDYNKRLDVSNVDGFYSKLTDVNANKGVLVSRKGFSKTAKQKADRLGITLCTAHDFDRELINIGFQIPIVFTSINKIEINFSYQSYLEAGTTIGRDIEIYIDDIELLEYFENEYKNGELNTKVLDEILSWKPSVDIINSAYMYDIDKNKIQIQSIELIYKLTGTYYFGYVHDLPNAIGINNLSDNEINIFIEPKDILLDYKTNLKSYKRKEELPQITGVNIIVSQDIDFKYSEKDLKLASIERIGN